MSDFDAAENFRRALADAAETFAEFRRQGGLVPAPESRESARAPSDESLRAALSEAAERLRALEGELRAARLLTNETLAENRRLSAEATDLRAAAAEAESRAVPLRERASLLAAECVRLESLRRKAEGEAAEAESAGRAVEENLKRRLRMEKEAADRNLAESEAQSARIKAEKDIVSQRLVAAVTRLQVLEQEKKLEAASGAGDASALQSELERTRAVVSALRAELAAARREKPS